ncbi:hypothetical protein ACFWBN_01615 [Streptomyces sp. NPDC059989]|uniref:hypothetical protein n=1 Tax=Streptomyces sp. NPDC059989 TaxID=3347026 RepID=UPI0036B46633
MHIVDIREIPGSPGSVTFTGSAGRAWGLWHGELPPDGSSHVEIDIPEPVTAWQPADSPDVLAGDPPADTTVCAVVDSVDEDGVVALRLASDIVLVDWEADGVPSAGERITFVTPGIELYPYTL